MKTLSQMRMLQKRSAGLQPGGLPALTPAHRSGDHRSVPYRACLYRGFRILAVASLMLAAASRASAQPYYVAGSLLTPNWNTTDPATQMSGGPSGYTAALPSVPDTIFEFKIAGTNWSANWPANNARIKGSATGSNTFYFYPGISVDGWLPLSDRVGYADPGNMTWGIAGDFDSWDGTQVQLASIGNGMFSNNIIVATAGSHSFKFQSPPGSWFDINFGADLQNGGGDGSFTTTNGAQTLPVVLDLPRGRWVIGQPAPAPVANAVVFAVDMASQQQLGRFDPGTDGVFVSGTFNGWPGTGGGGLVLTNVPTYTGGNTNIYYATKTIIGRPGSVGTYYRFTCNNPNTGNNGYEARSTDRAVNLLSVNGTLHLPVVSFADLYTSDLLSHDTPVTFRVDMRGATGTDNVVFNTNTDSVYLNGQFTNWYAWGGGPNPAPAGFQMINQGNGIYTNTVTIPAGTPVAFAYKYGMDQFSLDGGPKDDEAPFMQNHFRVIRNPGFNPYILPVDQFGSQYSEPFFSSADPAGARLTVSPPTNGIIPVRWLGRPDARLQWTTNLTGGPWQEIAATDGTNWLIGTPSTNGFISQTNWPKTGKSVFFRLSKPN